MPNGPGFCLDWESGASAQLELFSPNAADPTMPYKLKYTPPFRSTIRPPREDRPLRPAELAPISIELDKMASNGVNRAPVPPGAAAPIDPLEMMGSQLLDLALPRYIQADLRAQDVYLDIGLDEPLLGYPWEIMYDGSEYLCLKHSLGRFVNADSPIALSMKVANWQGTQLPSINVLVISVEQPMPRNGGPSYARLTAVEAETDAIVKALTGQPNVSVGILKDGEATYNKVYQALKQKEFHIIHFCGHASFDPVVPSNSALVLHDRDMTTGPIKTFFGDKPPVLCFVNACESVRQTTWRDNYDVFGLARALLETGAYLLGSRWKIGDQPAATFATEFYNSLIMNGNSIGEAVRDARKACRASSPNDLAWASYIYYGDPRVYFRRLP